MLTFKTMKIAPYPVDEELRLKDLKSYDILDSANEEEYDSLVELASQICNCPVALITFIDKERQWFKAKKELADTETNRDVAFCSHTILQNEVMIVGDAKNDARFADNPLVTGKMQIGFYAGAPIVSSAGHKLGSVCVIDHTKKEGLNVQQQKGLKIIAQQISKLLELRVKNKLVVKHAELQIEAEKRISQLIVAEADNKDSVIAYQLHENLAQSLAAIKLFLESAEGSKDLQGYFLSKGVEVITQLIDDVRSLSKSIIPTTLENADYYWIICEYANEYAKQHKIDIKLGQPTTIKSKTSTIGLNLFRMVQNLLEIAKIAGAKKVFFSIKVDLEISLDFKYDIPVMEADMVNTDLLNNITTRVTMLNGTIKQHSSNSENFIQINLPI